MDISPDLCLEQDRNYGTFLIESHPKYNYRLSESQTSKHIIGNIILIVWSRHLMQ